MPVTELSVFIENKHGRIADIANILGENEISIDGFDVAHTPNGYGIFRLMVKDVMKATKILAEKGFTVREKNVIAIGMEHKAKALSNILKTLAKENININYIYVAANNVLSVSTSNDEKAQKLLEEQGCKTLTQEDL